MRKDDVAIACALHFETEAGGEKLDERFRIGVNSDASKILLIVLLWGAACWRCGLDIRLRALSERKSHYPQPLDPVVQSASS